MRVWSPRLDGSTGSIAVAAGRNVTGAAFCPCNDPVPRDIVLRLLDTMLLMAGVEPSAVDTVGPLALLVSASEGPVLPCPAAACAAPCVTWGAGEA